MPRAGIEPALSGPQPDVLPLYYRGKIQSQKYFIYSLHKTNRSWFDFIFKYYRRKKKILSYL